MSYSSVRGCPALAFVEIGPVCDPSAAVNDAPAGCPSSSRASIRVKIRRLWHRVITGDRPRTRVAPGLGCITGMGWFAGVELRVLGPVQVPDAWVSLPLGGAKQRAVLVMLALHANRVVSTDALIESLWGDAPPDGAPNVLQASVSRLRKVLNRPDHSLRLERRPPGYVLTVLAGVDGLAAGPVCRREVLDGHRSR